MPVTVVDHPLVQHKLALLRDTETKPGEFRRLVREITLLAAYEALRDLPLESGTVQTPLAVADVHRLRGPAPAIVTILRAGLAMVEPILDLIPNAVVGHLGLYRDHETHEPIEYFGKLPVGISERQVLIVDPMLATGNSAVRAIDIVRRAGAQQIRLLSVIGCPEGVAAVSGAHPSVTITVAGLDERLNEQAYIVPGLGDAGDRLYGTR